LIEIRQVMRENPGCETRRRSRAAFVAKPRVRVTIGEADSEVYSSAVSLAYAFGSAILEPSWWPSDAGPIGYRLARIPEYLEYVIVATRGGDDRLTLVIGHAEVPGAGREAGDWYAPPELENLRGLVGWTGYPRSLHAVVNDEGLAIHLFGYDSEADVVRAAQSLRRVSAGE
jgi:hypothetical protein